MPGANRKPQFDWVRVITLLVCVCFLAIFQPAQAARMPEYSDTLLAEWQQRYPRGILSNYTAVILPNLDAEDRRKLAGVRFEFPLRIKNREPFAFATDVQGRTIYMSIQSLKFLDEATIAIAWLNRNGYTMESVTNYFIMLQHWKETAPPPSLFSSLCIPANALDNKEVDGLAQKSFRTAIFYVMLHEIGHIIYRHEGAKGVDPAVSRAREEEADAYALKIMARVGEPPLGVVNLFLTMAYLNDGRTDFSSDTRNEKQLAARTHPLSAERMRTFAKTLENTAANYAGEGLSRFTLVGIAVQIRLVAQNFLEIQHLSAMIGRAITPIDLGPMRLGEKLGRLCTGPIASDQAFSGRFKGSVMINNVEFDMGAEMTRTGNHMTGRSSAGIGFSKMEGIIEGDTLHYRWYLGQDAGKGVLRWNGQTYAGSWGNGESNRGGGKIKLQRHLQTQ